jgi:hypothetical protein
VLTPAARPPAMITTRTVITLTCDSYKGRKPDRYGGGWDDGSSADNHSIRCPESREITGPIGNDALTVAEAIRIQRENGWTISRERGGWRVRCAGHAGSNGKTIPAEERPYV